MCGEQGLDVFFGPFGRQEISFFLKRSAVHPEAENILCVLPLGGG